MHPPQGRLILMIPWCTEVQVSTVPGLHCYKGTAGETQHLSPHMIAPLQFDTLFNQVPAAIFLASDQMTDRGMVRNSHKRMSYVLCAMFWQDIGEDEAWLASEPEIS